MALKKGVENMNANYNELMANVNSPARKKAILTLAKKHNISIAEATHRQSLQIIQRMAQQK